MPGQVRCRIEEGLVDVVEGVEGDAGLGEEGEVGV